MASNHDLFLFFSCFFKLYVALEVISLRFILYILFIRFEIAHYVSRFDLFPLYFKSWLEEIVLSVKAAYAFISAKLFMYCVFIVCKQSI